MGPGNGAYRALDAIVELRCLGLASIDGGYNIEPEHVHT